MWSMSHWYPKENYEVFPTIISYLYFLKILSHWLKICVNLVKSLKFGWRPTRLRLYQVRTCVSVSLFRKSSLCRLWRTYSNIHVVLLHTSNCFLCFFTNISTTYKLLCGIFTQFYFSLIISLKNSIYTFYSIFLYSSKCMIMCALWPMSQWHNCFHVALVITHTFDFWSLICLHQW